MMETLAGPTEGAFPSYRVALLGPVDWYVIERALLVDGHEVRTMKSGLPSLISGPHSEFDVMLVADPWIHLPDWGSLELSRAPSVPPACIWTSANVPSLLRWATGIGFMGYLLHEDALEVAQAVLHLATGGAYFSASLCRGGSNILPETSVLRGDGTPRAQGGQVARSRAHLIDWLRFDLGLTRSEAEIAFRLREGLSKKQVATQLGCATSTVATHTAAIYAKLRLVGVVNVASLAVTVERSLVRYPDGWQGLSAGGEE